MATRYRDRNSSGRTPVTKQDLERLAPWNEARFGMFIHWGIYSVAAGEWKGQDIDGIGEWIQFRAEIPIEEYEKLAPEFNPVKFNAKEWVGLAKEAGMKYLTITSKHHDGFAMYDSAVSEYDIIDATPFGRDPMKELADACHEAGISLCFYYSQDQDWHRPDASGNSWDFSQPMNERDFDHYLTNKVKPQLKEILTNYGPIGLIWFDTPVLITPEQSADLVNYVHELQPNCLASGRIGNGVGDFGELGDNQIPSGVVDGFWETPATMNDTWAFKNNDHNWKSVRTLLHLLADLAGKGVNYLLNVGPTAEGEIPPESIERLQEVGKWMRTNGDAIYGTSANPFPYSFDWGSITTKGQNLYLLFKTWPGSSFSLHGLRSRVQKAYLLTDPNKSLDTTQSHNDTADHDVLKLSLPSNAPDENLSVVVLELDGFPDVDPLSLQQPNGSVTLIPSMAELHGPKDDGLEIAMNGATQNWYATNQFLSWQFKINTPGTFEVKVITGTPRGLERAKEMEGTTSATMKGSVNKNVSLGGWEGGHNLSLTVDKKSLGAFTSPDEAVDTPHAHYFPEFATSLGTIELGTSGNHELVLNTLEVSPESLAGINLVSMNLFLKDN